MANGLFNPSELYSFLVQNNYLPKIVNTPLEQGTSGEYSSFSNRINLSPLLNEKTADKQKNVLAHEMTHSVQSLMADKAYKLSNSYFLSPEEKQFLKAFKEFQKQPLLTAQDKQDKYRTLPNEVGAFGVGNMSVKEETDYPTKSHVDATAASELAILMDLFKRAFAPQKTIENLKYKDPFAPTIK